MEEEQNDGCRDATNWKVNVETPAPSRMVRKHTTNQRPNNRRKAIRNPNEARIQRSLGGLNNKRNDGVRAGTDPRSSHTRDGTSDDQGR